MPSYFHFVGRLAIVWRRAFIGGLPNAAIGVDLRKVKRGIGCSVTLLVEISGLEPLTLCLQSRCSTN